MKIASYTPGSMYKRFHLSNARAMNRKILRQQLSFAATAGAIIYGAKVEQSQALGQIVVQQGIQAAKRMLLDISA